MGAARARRAAPGADRLARARGRDPRLDGDLGPHGAGAELTAPFLVLDGLGKRFGGAAVLADVSLAVAQGELLALLGPSGSGKTTLLRLLAGFETPDSGRVLVGGEDVTAVPPARRRFGMVFQHYALFPHLTVGENVAFGLESQGASRDRVAARVAEALALVDLAGFAGRRVGEISGGQQQRVALARALAPEPRLLLLDEPLSNLDPTLRERTRRELRAALRRVGITSIFVTHEQEEAFALGDRVALLHAGRVQQVGAPRDLYRRPATRFAAGFVGRASALAGVVERAAGEEVEVRLEGAGGLQRPVVWPAFAPEGLEPGERVELLVRPETLVLTNAGVSLVAAPDLGGRVAELRFAGPLSYAVVALPGGGEIEALAPGAAQVGDEVAVYLERERGPLPVAFRVTKGGE